MRPFISSASRTAPLLCRNVMMSAVPSPAAKREGDISDAFASLSGAEQTPLPPRFRQLKCELVEGREPNIQAAWTDLLDDLKRENQLIAKERSKVVPEIQFEDLGTGLESVRDEVRKRGVLVVRNVVPEAEARAYKTELESYIRDNPSTRAFPAHDPQVWELYWSAPQVKARSHPALLKVQKLLMSRLWHKTDSSSKISLENPLSYADRLRIRQPGDASFALGPHIDGGGVERWEKEGYGLAKTYDDIFAGNVREYDPWDASKRVDVQMNLYDGLSACSMFRAWQGWLSMSHAGAGEGTLLVNPLLKLSTAYLLLRPFFRPLLRKQDPGFLEAQNWAFTGMDGMTSDLQGATPGRGQELNDELHPHLELDVSMVHVPRIRPGDFVAWHCDTIHAVDKVHSGKSDSSVLYIPVCPVTDNNARYLLRQRESFLAGTPGPDFGGGKGESEHIGRPTADDLRAWTNEMGVQAMGLEKLVSRAGAAPGEVAAVESANSILGL
ncbi:hypothetical protein NLU13_9965 [Sarocladium strictum]|uniref:DUF1479 domain protein n=1 Tax=Sarocladium strictum TaxID=5046 RepID=A0AA39G9T9_SARSR|nr:hypothetical protein NLU13_9965 [Sarocladium strictum]